MCWILLNDVIVIVIIIIIIIIINIIIVMLNININNWSLFYKYWFLIELVNGINFLGEHGPRKRPPRKGVLMGPSLVQLFIVSIWTSWLLETSDFR